jgi:hypothetical protein
MIAKKIVRFTFIASLVLAIATPIVVASVGRTNSMNVIAHLFKAVPGINSHSGSGPYEVAHVIGIGVSLFLALTNLAILLLSRPNIQSAVQRISKYSITKRLLFGLFGIITATVPWLIDVKPTSHQISSLPFQIATDNLFIFATLCGGIYLYTFAFLLFSLIVLKGLKGVN